MPYNWLTFLVSLSSNLSDHFFINIDVSLQKQYVSANVISHRQYKLTDKGDFLVDLPVSSHVLDPQMVLIIW